ncbi:MAG TPA: MltA domain-containing protein, partial [Rhizomicrobium sp.]|nr:MltA domain-containing protein [Rhizomicrobium sp.]
MAVWWFTRPPPRLAVTSFSELPGWQSADLNPALAAFRRSCDVIDAKPAGERINDYAGTAGEWQKVCARASGDARAFFEKNFTPYRLGGQGLFTGYYEPEIRGSRLRHDAFQTPVY